MFVSDTHTVIDQVMSLIVQAAVSAVGRKGEFHLALSGGSTPQPLYTRLAIDPDARNMPWLKTHLWIVDERQVPETDDQSNVKMIRETLADHTPMRSRQIHAVPVEQEDPGAAYESQLREVFGQPEAPPRIDFMLLGMGDDGHTASLFPGSGAIGETERMVVVNEGPAVTPPPRVTMTYPLINAARIVGVLITGDKKRQMLWEVEKTWREKGADPDRLPITGVSPQRGRLEWFIDHDAAGTDAEDEAIELA
ncbi:MAG: 6-phosphogluconolactonase [Phycisphaeraceae bacterium]|nr:6-phosphogluconolactonase [Phycisphaeraceae bacterium]